LAGESFGQKEISVTTSGTTTFNLDLNDAVEEAFERCGAELRTGYDLRTARRSLNLLFADWANRGINMWTFNQGMIPLVQGTNTYTLPSDTVDLLEHVIRTGAGNVSTQVDLTITRISVSTYSSIPNKLQQARPIQVLVNRNSNATYPAASSYSPGATAAPSITVWPTPDQTGVYQFVYWYLRRIQDAGAGGEATQDIPFRFIPCLVSGLAYYLAMKLPGGMERLQILKAQYDEDWDRASSEDREKAAVRFVPRQMFIS
jgi:hypothetical protein